MTAGAPIAARGFAWIPNALTLCRIALALGFPWIPQQARLAAICVALITEFLDGFLARRFGWESRAGQLLDPLADKLLCAVVVVTFLLEGRMSLLELAAVGSRDALVLLGAALLAAFGRWSTFREMKPLPAGKLATVIQYAVFFLLVIGRHPPPALYVAAFAVGLVAGLQYVARFFYRGS
jgi:phosphatidylglycerophosphate synthase